MTDRTGREGLEAKDMTELAKLYFVGLAETFASIATNHPNKMATAKLSMTVGGMVVHAAIDARPTEAIAGNGGGE